MENVHVVMVIYHLIMRLVLKVSPSFIFHNLLTFILDTHEELITISTNYKSLLGGKCLTNQNCQKIDARCLNHICICPHGYFAIDDWNCLEDAGRN
jgi:hypothetical protein